MVTFWLGIGLPGLVSTIISLPKNGISLSEKAIPLNNVKRGKMSRKLINFSLKNLTFIIIQ
jgi:hypothetical protein